MPEFPSPYVRRSNSPPHPTLSSPASLLSLISTSSHEGEPDPPDITDASTLSEVFQDSRPLQPANEPTASSERMPRLQSRPSSPHPSTYVPQRITCLDDTGTPVPTSPVPSPMITEESHLLAPPPASSEAPSIIEVGANASTQLPTSDTIPEVFDTRQQEPPFMTDGRGRVVWSRSGVKRGSSPSGMCSQDRTQHAAGDRY